MEKQALDDYVSRMTEIRKLSAPSLDGVPDADAYGEILRKNFIRIGELAGANRTMMERELNPFLQSDSSLSQEEVEQMMYFGDQLIYAEECENLDLPVMSMLSDRLVRDAEEKHDICCMIRYLDGEISTCYALMNMTERIEAYPEIALNYRKRGLSIGAFFMKYLEKERFAAIGNQECKEMILTNARYSTVFYEHLAGDVQANQRNLDILETMLSISKEPFYHQQVPGYDWSYFTFRTLEYYASCTDYCNARGFTREQLDVICDRTEQFYALCQSNPERFKDLSTWGNVRLLLLRNQFLAGRSSEKVYREGLLKLYHDRDKADHSVSGLIENMLYPLEYIFLLDPKRMSAEDKTILKGFYQDITAYVFNITNNGVFSFLLEFFTGIINHFNEVPSGIGFEDMVLRCLAVLHPPTYVHSLMVGQITECLCDHLLDRNPEFFVGVCGCGSREEVLSHQDSIRSFAYHAALCHDFGKISIIDTIFVYGRELLDMEFRLIQTHPRTGYGLLSRYESTCAYADVALGHHKWYDDSRGYPSDFQCRSSPVSVIIDLVRCADCMDAATDTVGRSYKKGKSLDGFIEELRKGSGTCYAPWLSDLLMDQEVQKDIDYLLTKGRRQNYRDTYLLLRDVQQSGE